MSSSHLKSRKEDIKRALNLRMEKVTRLCQTYDFEYLVSGMGIDVAKMWIQLR